MSKHHWLAVLVSVVVIVCSFPNKVSEAASQKLVINCGPVYTVNPDGTGKTKVFNEIFNTHPVASPDGSEIAWGVQNGHWGVHISVIRISDAKVLFTTPPEWNGDLLYANQPAWSPTGNQIAFYAQLFIKNSSKLDKKGLFVMNADGSGIHILAELPYLSMIAWSPDGQHLAAADYVNVYIMNADGTNLQSLTNQKGNSARNYDVAWTADSRFITFVSTREGKPDLYQMDIAGQNVIRLSKTKAIRYSPAWSPDGSQIAFIRSERGHTYPYVMNADGSNEHVLFKENCYSVSWR